MRRMVMAPLMIILAIILLLTLSCSNDKPNDSKSNIPQLTTAQVTQITQTTAQCGGIVTSDGEATITARGVCWNTNQTPAVTDNKTTDSTGVGSFTSFLTGLTAGATYYARAYATNSAGTGYGSEVSFNTLSFSGIVTDIDGNVYQTIIIGAQQWMAENLKAIHYRNGDAIPNVTDDVLWAGLTAGAYCDYNNIVNNASTYGHLYNWFAVNDSHNIAPVGWHVATDAEWQTLTDYLGGDAIAGGKMKAAGITRWDSPNSGATNESAFSALPGGYRGVLGTGYYSSIGWNAYFWTSTESSSVHAWYRILTYLNSSVGRSVHVKQEGYSIRCVKD